MCVKERETETEEAERERGRERIKYIMYIWKATKDKKKSRYIFSQVSCGFFFLFEKLQYKCPSQVEAFHSGYLFILLSPLESDAHVLWKANIILFIVKQSL